MPSATPNHVATTRNARDEPAVLKFLYVATTALCAFMIVWILIFPSSSFQEHSETLRHLFHTYAIVDDKQVTHPDLLQKYQGQYLVQLTHILPGAIWAGLIPVQLHNGIRQQHRQLHRLSGYVFVGAACLMTCGVFVILHRGLLYENFFPDLDPPAVSAGYSLTGFGLYFGTTALAAVYYAGMRRDYVLHRAWIIRHVASGIWIALQRLLLITVFDRPPFTREEQRDVFGHAAVIAIGISLTMGEYVVYLLNLQTQSNPKQS